MQLAEYYFDCLDNLENTVNIVLTDGKHWALSHGQGSFTFCKTILRYSKMVRVFLLLFGFLFLFFLFVWRVFFPQQGMLKSAAQLAMCHFHLC